MLGLGFQTSLGNLWDSFPRRFIDFYLFNVNKHFFGLPVQCSEPASCVGWKSLGKRGAFGELELPVSGPSGMDSAGTRSYLIMGASGRACGSAAGA